MDWADLTKPGRMRAWYVEPNRLDHVLGEMRGVKWDACSVECGYYVDTRTTAKLVVRDTDWDWRSWIRLTYETDEGMTEIGTYIVTDDPATYEKGRWETQLSLNSVLWGLSQEKAYGALSIAKGATTAQTLRRIFGYCACAYSISGLKEYTASRVFTLERGKSMLEWLFAVANYTGNRVDVTGHGVVTVRRRVMPADIPQALTLDLEDPRGLALDRVGRKSDWLTTPGRVVVHHQAGSGDDAKDIVGVATVADSHNASFASRGYLMTEYESVSDMSPETKAQADYLAKQKLGELSVNLTEWECETVYLPIWAGTGVTLLPHDYVYQGARKCFVKSLSMSDLHLNRPTLKLTLKQCFSGDKGDE